MSSASAHVCDLMDRTRVPSSTRRDGASHLLNSVATALVLTYLPQPSTVASSNIQAFRNGDIL